MLIVICTTLQVMYQYAQLVEIEAHKVKCYCIHRYTYFDCMCVRILKAAKNVQVMSSQFLRAFITNGYAGVAKWYKEVNMQSSLRYSTFTLNHIMQIGKLSPEGTDHFPH